MTNQSTDNYFLDNGFNEEAINYIKFDLVNRQSNFQKDYDFYDNQARMFARMSEEAKSNLAAVNYELGLAKAALAEVRLKKKQIA
jgi:hypothetical protein